MWSWRIMNKENDKVLTGAQCRPRTRLGEWKEYTNTQTQYTSL